MTEPERALDRFVSESHHVQSRFFSENRAEILGVAEHIAACLRGGGKILFFGNGGSAADAQHLASEFVGRCVVDRRALPALSLATDTSVLTSVGNDYGYEHVFSRQIEALGKPSDIAVAISTSGNSPNILSAIDAARQARLYTVGFTGESGGKMLDRVDVLLRVPSGTTPRIQETHILLGHVLCELVEGSLFPEIDS